MALTLDTIVDKTFTELNGGDAYDRNEVDDFLNDILEEMENREKETESLKRQIADLTEQLQAAKAEASQPKVSIPTELPKVERVTEGYEVVLNKAQSLYDDIVSEAKVKADGIIDEANTEAANIRTTAQKQITDLSDKLASLRKQTSDYYDQLSRVIERQNSSLLDLKKLL
ncbi:MAG: DivIVA domain-containing protein [Clostridia bacterium]|nr:DivIVA domain-containing protein [Clostridia bacterium]